MNPFTLFAFLSDKTEMPDHLRFAGFKILRTQSAAPEQEWNEAYEILFWVMVETAKFLGGKRFHTEGIESPFFPPDEFWEYDGFSDCEEMAKVVLTGFKPGTSAIFEGYWIEQEGRPVTVRSDKMMRIKNQMKAVEQMADVFFPVTVHFFDVGVQDETLRPSAMVLMTDYLMDITAFSSCLYTFGEFTSIYLLDKMKPYTHSDHLLIGNCVNALLDELIYNPDLEWDDPSKMIFRISELQWALYSARDTRQH